MVTAAVLVVIVAAQHSIALRAGTYIVHQPLLEIFVF
jgi:hypothetical protein